MKLRSALHFIKSKGKNLLINLIILVLALVLMLTFAEVAMRWLDGYQWSTFELQQDPAVRQAE